LLDEHGRRVFAEGKTGEARDVFDEAEEAFRRAVELDDQLPELWIALIQFLAATGETEAAEEAIEQARGKIPTDQRSLALAQAYERMGRPELAEQNYEKALADAPQDPAVARSVANFYYRKGEDLRSEAILNRIIGGQVKGKQADVVWARRRLAWILLGRFGVGRIYSNLEQALNLIEENLAAAGPTTENLRFKAFILAQDRDPERRKQATQIIESLPRRQRTASPDDLFMLWRLYLSQGAWSKAREQMISLLGAHGDRPKYVAAYASALLQRNQPREAELWVIRLEEIAPNWFSARELTTTTSLRAELLFVRAEASLARAEELSKENRSAEAEAELEEAKTLLGEVLDLMSRFVGNSNTQPSDEAERSSLVALALERFAQRLTAAGQKEMAAPFAEDAETLYREYVRSLPSRELLLVGFLGRQGRIGEALERLTYAWEDADPMMIARACGICFASPATTAEQHGQVEQVVQAALKKFDRPILLLLTMAQACAAQGRYPEAETFYREVIERNSENYQARNNLAVLLALQKTKLDEAEDLINQAIELAGPAGALLDSRASVYMALGEPRKALDDLKRAIAVEATPVRYFHQAQAYQENGQSEAAIEALKDAQKLGLQPEMLERLERPDYQRMLKLLK
ncbi:MAG: tetratricopeptide repeat protein, partial [Planctomycetota bacterium]